MAKYSSSEGKWKNYIIKPISLDLTVETAGNWDPSSDKDFDIRVVNDSKVDVLYKVELTNQTHFTLPDTYTWSYSLDNGSNWVGPHYHTGTTNHSIPKNGTALMDTVWISLDDGVEIKWNHVNGFDGTEEIRFTTPSESTYKANRVHFNGYATTLKHPTTAGNYSSYSEILPLRNDVYTAVFNTTGACIGHIHGSGVNTNNTRASVHMSGSMDKTNYSDFATVLDDVEIRTSGGSLLDNYVRVVIFDKEEASAYSSGAFSYYKIRSEYPAGAGGEPTINQYTYYQIALIQH